MSETSPAVAPYLFGQRNGFRWFHVEDVKGPALAALAAEFHLHELAVEDCRTTGTRAKTDEYEGHLFIVVNTLHFEKEKDSCRFGEFDIFVGKDFLISVHDGPSRTAAEVKPRFASEAKMSQPGRLLYELLRVIVGRYMPVLDTIDERMDAIEEKAYAQPSPQILSEIFSLKRALIEFRRVCTTMRDVVNQLLNRPEPWIRSQQMYFRDVYDHVVRALDFVDTYRDILTGILDVHLTATANRTNEIMKVLTIYTTIAAPILLITGYFGQNFDHLPLIHQPYGISVMHGLLVISSLGALWFFKRRGWY